MIPIYRAKKIDSDEYVEGYLTELWTNQGSEQRYAIDTATAYTNDEYSIYVYQINPSTLELSFDNINWYSEEDIISILGIAEDMEYNYQRLKDD